MDEIKNKKIRKATHCVDTSFENGAIILNTQTGIYIELNETGKFLWEKITKDLSFKELLKLLCIEYEVNQSEAEETLVDFVNQGIYEKIIEISDPS